MHSNRMFPYMVGAAALAAVAIAFGAPFATVLPFAIFLACPLMMFMMMRGMASAHGQEDHAGHGCEHDPTRAADSPSSPRERPVSVVGHRRAATVVDDPS
jgi:hypothetical protein